MVKATCQTDDCMVYLPLLAAVRIVIRSVHRKRGKSVKTIIVIDDEWSIREVVALMLQRAGHTVLSAATADEGLAHMASCKPDAVLLDVMMPGMNGLDLALEMYQKWPLVPVVLMSGRVSTEADSIQNFIGRFGITGSIPKPFTQEQLLEALNAAFKTE